MIEDLDVKWQDGKINQICEVVWDLEEAMERYWANMGFGPWYVWDMHPPLLHDYYYKGVKVEAAFRIALAQIGPIQYELTQPLYGMGIHRDHLETKGEGVHHIKIYYDDVDEAVKNFAQKDIYVLQEARYGPVDRHVFFDTEKKFGVIWEIGNCKEIGDPLKKYPE